MKKNILLPALMLASTLATTQLFAQDAPQVKKNEEIIIRKNGDKDQKMTVEVNGDSILVNGKPLSEYHDGDVSVLEKDVLSDDGQAFNMMPGHPGADMFKIESDEKPHSFLGVLSEKSDQGAKISEVVKGSVAEKSGLMKGDVITRIDDKSVSSPEDLMKIVRSYNPGDQISVHYLRNDRKNDVKVKLGETKNDNRTFIYRNNAPDWNGDAFHFNMPPMTKEWNGSRNFSRDFNLAFRDSRPKLGLRIQDTENGDGVKVLNVQEGSPADKAGLKKEDVITEVNNNKVKGVEDVMEQMGHLEEGQTIKIKALRNNAEMNFEMSIPRKLNEANL